MFSLTRAFPPEHLDSAVTLGVVQPQLGQGEGHSEGSAWWEDTYYVCIRMLYSYACCPLVEEGDCYRGLVPLAVSVPVVQHWHH